MYEDVWNEKKFMEEQRDFALIYTFFEVYADVF